MKKFVIVSIFLLIPIVFVILMDIPDWQKLDLNRITQGEASSVITDKDGTEVMFLSGNGNHIRLRSDEIPQKVKNAFVAAEDVRFYSHKGIDVKRILGAMYKNMLSGGIREGASTITQQLIKLTHLSDEKTIARKTNEAFLAMRLERLMTKDEILTHYINTVYFGEGAYGVESAARTYFSKGVSELEISEIAMLAGILKAPSALNPNVNSARAIERRNYVIETMFSEGMITKNERDEAIAKEIRLNMKAKENEKYAWYRDYVIDEAVKVTNLTSDELISGGYRIRTCIDRKRQERAEMIFENDTLFPPDAPDGTNVQAALAVLDNKTGGIYAIIGGRRYEVNRGLNRASAAKRQPGSVLKPIGVYAAAVDGMGLSPSYILDDTQRTFEGSYTPRNAQNSYNGLVTMREALSRSMNVASVGLMEFTGVSKVREYLKRFGIELTEKDNGLSLALGSITYGVTPLSVANAYNSLANGGMKTEAHAIIEIADRNGKTIYKYTAPVKRILTGESAYMLTNMLETAAQKGSARAFSRLEKPIAAKTGTVSVDENHNRDIWTAACTDTVSACVWMGFDRTDERHVLSASASGSSYPANLLAEFFEEEAAGPFRKPEGILTVTLDKAALETEYRSMLAPSGAPKNLTTTEIFRKGSEPKILSDRFSAPARPEAPEVIEKDGQVFIRFEIENENYEYLVIKEEDGQKEILMSIHAEEGEEVECAIERGENDFLIRLVARNRLMLEIGSSLLSEESEGVWISREDSFLSRMERIFDMG